MKKFETLTSTVIPLAMKDVDTDMIIPAQHLTQINREGYGQFLFEQLKASDRQFIFNQLQYNDSKILLTQSNFGCGSSREHAVWALQQAGIQVIIAPSFSDIFFNNAAKNGLLLITLLTDAIDDLFRVTDKTDLWLTVNLAQQTIRDDSRIDYSFNYDPFRKTCLLQGLDDMDYLLKAVAEADNA